MLIKVIGDCFYLLKGLAEKSQGWKCNPYNLGHCQRPRDPSRSARYLACPLCFCWSNIASLADSSFSIPQAILQAIAFQAGLCVGLVRQEFLTLSRPCIYLLSSPFSLRLVSPYNHPY
jgi:hypothetical protein